MKTTFSSSNDEDSSKIFISKLENRENFHDLKFFSQNFAKSHKIRKENARFFMKYSRIFKKKSSRPSSKLPQFCGRNPEKNTGGPRGAFYAPSYCRQTGTYHFLNWFFALFSKKPDKFCNSSRKRKNLNFQTVFQNFSCVSAV